MGQNQNPVGPFFFKRKKKKTLEAWEPFFKHLRTIGNWEPFAWNPWLWQRQWTALKDSKNEKAAGIISIHSDLVLYYFMHSHLEAFLAVLCRSVRMICKALETFSSSPTPNSLSHSVACCSRGSWVCPSSPGVLCTVCVREAHEKRLLSVNKHPCCRRNELKASGAF